jgi:hypothetical protein
MPFGVEGGTRSRAAARTIIYITEKTYRYKYKCAPALEKGSITVVDEAEQEERQAELPEGVPVC